MLLTFFISFFGLLIGFRTIKFHILNQMISEIHHNKCLTMICFAVTGVQFVLRNRQLLNLFLLLAVFIAPLLIFQFQELKRKIDFEKNLVSYLDAIVIRLRSGRSLKDSVQELGQINQGPSRYYFQEITSLLNFTSTQRKSSKDPLFEETLRELIEIHTTTHKAVDKIKAFRRKIRTEQEFRRKSRQVTLQVKAQSYILGTLFLALLGYTLTTYEFVVVDKMIFSSIGLFATGVVFNFQIARRFRWKV